MCNMATNYQVIEHLTSLASIDEWELHLNEWYIIYIFYYNYSFEYWKN
jgi:hypothetical protein